MQNPPVIDGDYLRVILGLSDNESLGAVEVTESAETNTALAVKLHVTIHGTAGAAEKKLFIKTARSAETNVYSKQNVKETRFYEFARNLPGIALPIPACCDAFVSNHTGAFFIVLEDISDRCRAPEDSDLAKWELWLSCAESLARFHAAFWNLRNAEGCAFAIATKQTVRENVNEDRCHLERFLAHAGERFDERTKSLFRRDMALNNARLAEERARILARRNVTLTNDDSHIHNFMLPIQGAAAPVLVDFQFWGRGIGAGDIAHLTRGGFPKEYRQTLHIALLQRYYQTLTTHGVDGYSWEECLRDYRLSVAAMVMIPVWQFAFFGLQYEDWSGGIDALIENYHALACDEYRLPA